MQILVLTKGTQLKTYILAAALLLPCLATAQDHAYSQRPGDTRTPEKFLADCNAGIAIASCYAQPVAPDCAPGKHWSIATGYARCVLDELICTPGNELVDAGLGKRECKPIVCPPGSELIDGKCSIAPAPPVQDNTWSGRVTSSAMCGHRPENVKATGCNANLGATVTNWLSNNVSPVASQNSEIQAAIQFFYANCPTILVSHSDERKINFTSSSGAVSGYCITMFDPELMPYRPRQVKYDSISNWYLNLTNIPR